MEENLFLLNEQLINKTYIHDPYESFYICDPKRRHIHKASVRDRVLHQAVFQILYLIFDKHFIYDSFSSRNYKGTHLGVERLFSGIRKESKNWKVKCFTLKCDVRKFFDFINHGILFDLIKRKIKDRDTLWLIRVFLESFETEKGKGLPLGNVTSQLFANIYLNELDQFVKHTLKARYYFRYCDDFVIVHKNREFLEKYLVQIKEFLLDSLLLELHPHKVEIRKVAQGIDFLGYIVLPHAVILRTKTKRRILRKINDKNVQSYLGVLSYCRARKLREYVISVAKECNLKQ